MITCDYHMHTKRCGHASGEVADYVAEAVRKGLSEIGFSDHLPFVTHRDPHYTMDISELSEYHREIEKARDDSRNLTVRVGIEADFVEGRMPEIEGLIRSYPYDFVIGSVHFIKDWAFDDPRQKEKWNEADIDRVYKRYYGLLQQSARTRSYDIIGHVDLVKKFGHRSAEDLTELIEETARVFKDCGICIEINTSGLRKPVKEIYPHIDVLRTYKKHHVPIVFGSDAHAPADVGADFNKAAALAKEAGYTEYATFEKRKIKGFRKL